MKDIYYKSGSAKQKNSILSSSSFNSEDLNKLNKKPQFLNLTGLNEMPQQMDVDDLDDDGIQ